MTKHTPGPWTAYQRESEKGTNYYRILLHDHPENQRLYGSDSLCGYCGEANARLIAAAPDLLKALQDLVSGLENVVAPIITQDARTAIIKATQE